MEIQIYFWIAGRSHICDGLGHFYNLTFNISHTRNISPFYLRTKWWTHKNSLKCWRQNSYVLCCDSTNSHICIYDFVLGFNYIFYTIKHENDLRIYFTPVVLVKQYTYFNMRIISEHERRTMVCVNVLWASTFHPTGKSARALYRRCSCEHNAISLYLFVLLMASRHIFRVHYHIYR